MAGSGFGRIIRKLITETRKSFGRMFSGDAATAPPDSARRAEQPPDGHANDAIEYDTSGYDDLPDGVAIELDVPPDDASPADGDR